MSIDLKYANADKSMDAGGWIVDYKYLEQIQNALYGLKDTDLHVNIEVIEAVLLIANGEDELLKKALKEIGTL